MSYLPVRFPMSIAREPVGGPGFMTRIGETLSGTEQRNEEWSRSRHRFEVSQGIKTETDFREIGAHFRMARGRLHKFRFRDWSDYKCERRDGALLSLTATTFQAYKNYGAAAGFIEARRLTRIYPGSLQVWKDGVLQSLTVDEETGIATFAIAPGAALLELACSFDVPARYDTDELKATLVQLNKSRDSFIGWQSVPVVEVRE